MIRFVVAVALLVLDARAHPVRVGVDYAVNSWNYRCTTNNPTALNSTFTLLAQSQWMGAVRAGGLYPGIIIRANLMAGASFGGTNGAGDSITSTNIGSPQVPLINDEGGALDTTTGSQDKWKYSETGTAGGLGANGTNIVTLNTGLSPANIVAAHATWPNDAHLAFYAEGSTNTADISIIGARDASSVNPAVIVVSPSGAGQRTDMWQVGTPANAVTNDNGFYVGTRTGSGATGVQQYRNNLATGTSSSVGGTPVSVTANLHMYGLNQQGTGIVANSGVKSGGYVIGLGVTATQVTNAYYNAFQQYETLLGRQK